MLKVLVSGVVCGFCAVFVRDFVLGSLDCVFGCFWLFSLLCCLVVCLLGWGFALFCWVGGGF